MDGSKKKRTRAHTGVDHGDENHEPRPIDAFTEGKHREGTIMMLVSNVHRRSDSSFQGYLLQSSNP